MLTPDEPVPVAVGPEPLALGEVSPPELLPEEGVLTEPYCDGGRTVRGRYSFEMSS